jgi:hypothetical protein
MQHAGARNLREDDYAQVRPSRPDLRLVEGQRRAGREAQASARRTVVITGQPLAARRRRPIAAQQIQARPDRIALWAFLLGLFMVFVAVATANAAV